MARRLGMLAAHAWLALGALDVARAVVLILANGDHVSGELEGTEVQLLGSEGAARLARADIAAVRLDGLGADVVTLRSGRTLTGHVDQAVYRIRLASGQTVEVSRSGVAEFRLRAP